MATTAATGQNADTADLQAMSSPTTTNKETPDASETPYSAFGRPTRWIIICITTVGMVLCSISGQIYFPVMPILVAKYHMTPTLINLSMTTYMLIQGIAPAIVSNFADTCGRRPAWIMAFSIYTAANVGLAFQNSYAALMVLRCIQSAGGSVSSSLGYAVVADISPRETRGQYVGIMSAGIMVPIALGPTIGGLLSHFLGWRSVFWFLVIGSGSYLLIYTVAVPETARQIVGNGSAAPAQWWGKSVIQHVSGSMRRAPSQNTAKLAFPNPLECLSILRQQCALVAILCFGVVFFGFTAVMTATANRFGDIYHLNSFQVGLCYLPLGLAGCVGSVLNGKIADLNFRRVLHKEKRNRGDPDFPIKRVRLQVAIPLLVAASIVTLPYGWIVQQGLPLPVPLVFQGLIGFIVVPLTGTLTMLVVDLFPDQAATASAACNLARCWLGALAAAVVDIMVQRMGWGWCFLLMGLAMVAAATFLVVKYVQEVSGRADQEQDVMHQQSQTEK